MPQQMAVKPWSISKLLRRALNWTFLLLVIRKSYQGLTATHYVRKCWDTLSPEAFLNDQRFQDFVSDMKQMDKPPAIFILNQFALPMTLNWLCNTALMEDVHKRAVFVTLDQRAKDVLTELWPDIRQLYWPNHCFKDPFTFADDAYQALYSLRSNLATALIESGQAFWMMQQDTFWNKNLFELDLESQPGYDILFDQIGATDDDLRAEWINGANFFVRPSETSKKYFEYVGKTLRWLYAPDMGIMIYQCASSGKSSSSKCGYMSHTIVNSWEWMLTDRTKPPHIMQLDCETDNGGKIGQMKKLGFYFLNQDGRTCNQTAVQSAQRSMEQGYIEYKSKSWGRLQFWLYWYLADALLSVPVLGPLWKPYLPMWGFYALITV